jgi:hypothetical protein
MNLSTFFEDNSGGLSMTRLLGLLWTLFLCFNWTYSCINLGYLAEIPYSVYIITALYVAGKVIQRFGEKNVS